ncbi:MAG: anthranilate synthase component I family protein, partial [Nitrososphaerales archaeon]
GRDYSYILESLIGPEKLAEYSFIGFDPGRIVKIQDGKGSIEDSNSGQQNNLTIEDPMAVVRSLVSRKVRTDLNYRFLGGAVGYVSYDAIRYWEKLPSRIKETNKFPDIELAIFDDGLIVDHNVGSVFYYYGGRDRSQEITESVKQGGESPVLDHGEVTCDTERSSFEKNVEKSKELIANGDIFQVVLSKRYSFSLKGSTLPFYLNLRRLNPSPYMYYIKMGKREIVGSSPEMLVRVEGEQVRTFPIAGTRPSAKDKGDNQRLANELKADPKDRSEHIMLVDLARNDLGRICEYGTVTVPELMKIHQFSHVQHMVSEVRGRLRKESDSYEALKAVFPAGTVSGAPKVRAMEIIEEFENVRRGPYAGAVGYFSANGNSDFAITIRTMVVSDGKGYIQAGAGIVADSVPEKEWFETEDKSRAMLDSLRLAAGDRR